MFDISQLRFADGPDPHVKKELYEAIQQVLLCLDSLTDLLLTPGSSEDQHQLRLLQQEVTDCDATSTHILHSSLSIRRKI